MISEQVQANIRSHAVASYPLESCGLIVIVNGKERYWPCKNVADDPRQVFAIAPTEYATVEDMGEIIAVVHSHPDKPNKPSQSDKVMCEASGLRWHIVHVSIPDGESELVATDIHTFDPEGYVAPLVGRMFVHGVLDCYALVRDYFTQEMGITLPDFERHDNWWNNGQNLYMENFEKAGFAPIKGPLQVGDGILIQLRAPVANHAAVYIGNGQILHHVYNRMSSRDIYDGYWQENTVAIVRHKDAK